MGEDIVLFLIILILSAAAFLISFLMFEISIFSSVCVFIAVATALLALALLPTAIQAKKTQNKSKPCVAKILDKKVVDKKHKKTTYYFEVCTSFSKMKITKENFVGNYQIGDSLQGYAILDNENYIIDFETQLTVQKAGWVSFAIISIFFVALSTFTILQQKVDVFNLLGRVIIDGALIVLILTIIGLLIRNYFASSRRDVVKVTGEIIDVKKCFKKNIINKKMYVINNYIYKINHNGEKYVFQGTAIANAKYKGKHKTIYLNETTNEIYETRYDIKNICVLIALAIIITVFLFDIFTHI